MTIPPKFIIKKYSQGETILTKGQRGDTLAYILSGSVDILQNQSSTGTLQTTATLYKGDILGEMALLTGAPRNATAIAHQDTEIVWVNKRTFDLALVNEDFPILKDMVIKIAQRLAQTEAMNIKYQKRIIELEAQQIDK